MICPKCQTRLFTLRTYSAGPTMTTRDLKCLKCGYMASSIEHRVERPQEAVLGREGSLGAKDLKSKILHGEVRPPEIRGITVEQSPCTEENDVPAQSS